MAQKALYTSVHTCQKIWAIFFQDKAFKYEGFLKKYPIANVGQYSTAVNVNENL